MLKRIGSVSLTTENNFRSDTHRVIMVPIEQTAPHPVRVLNAEGDELPCDDSQIRRGELFVRLPKMGKREEIYLNIYHDDRLQISPWDDIPRVKHK